ncbi:MAG: hypothetical protein K2G16_04360, partial [Lachnospiraceae bacterium]|nr:hypothetical protein [Lachnospiraceae bacterium]
TENRNGYLPSFLSPVELLTFAKSQSVSFSYSIFDFCSLDYYLAAKNPSDYNLNYYIVLD